MEDIGIRLKKARLAKGLSQRQLALSSGVSNAMICLIERGKSNPSLGLLKKILDKLPISISEFFSFELEDEPAKVFYEKDDLTEIGSGLISYLQLGSNRQKINLQLMYECYQPGADTGRSMLHHEAEEGGIVISGRIELTVGDRTRILGPGDAYLFNSRTPHRFRNIDKEACTLVSACTPPSF
ncbi:MAG: transcriptional regulator with XRE-family HTH domain [Planctomycetota bacterium]|jgi:transcriptional regulator with XRE-family HTH domain